jgi:hypothetical protein
MQRRNNLALAVAKFLVFGGIIVAFVAPVTYLFTDTDNGEQSQQKDKK